jgi:hypothetical protein
VVEGTALKERSAVSSSPPASKKAHANSCIQSSSPAVFHLDIHRKSIPSHRKSPAARDRARKTRRRKRSPLTLTLDNEGSLYFADVSLGTPGQELRLDIDTGSSDIWSNSQTSNLCKAAGNACGTSGTYNANKSSTYTYVNSDFTISYADGSYARGDYATDTLLIGGTAIDNVPFGVGYSSTSNEGVMGVGYMTNEALVAVTGQSYYNLPFIMKQAGVINRMAYSLWLNDLDSSTGSILFGGVDTDKFSGDLGTLPIIREDGEYREFLIALTGLSVAGQTIVDPTVASDAIPVLLDSGSSLSYLPTTYAQAIFSVFNADYDSTQGQATISCSLSSSPDTFTFTFSGVQIAVKMSELVVLSEVVHGGQDVCVLGITDSGTDHVGVLGDTFLRSAYVVYDLDNNEISLGQTVFNATSSNVEAMSSGTNSLPSATTPANAVTSLAVSGTGGAHAPDVTQFPGQTGAAAASVMMPEFYSVAGLGVVFALAALVL